MDGRNVGLRSNYDFEHDGCSGAILSQTAIAFVDFVGLVCNTAGHPLRPHVSTREISLSILFS